MNARSRPTPAEQFVYGDEQWMRMRAIVERAGNVAARDKFDAQRTIFEKMVGGHKTRLGKWNGFEFGIEGEISDTKRFERISAAARELGAALDDLNLPAIFQGNDLIWKRLDGTEANWEAERNENWRRYREFCSAIAHVRERAASHAEPAMKRKTTHYARNMFFVALGENWREELGLRITAGTEALFVQFVEAASKGVYSFKNAETAREAIVNSMRDWPRRRGCKNDDEKN